MKNSCFRTSASILVKRNKVRIKCQKFGYSALLRIYIENSESIETIISFYIEKTQFQNKKEKMKQSLSAEKLERGDPLCFPVCCKISKKNEGGPFGDKKNQKKSHSVENN